MPQPIVIGNPIERSHECMIGLCRPYNVWREQPSSIKWCLAIGQQLWRGQNISHPLAATFVIGQMDHTSGGTHKIVLDMGFFAQPPKRHSKNYRWKHNSKADQGH